MSNESLRPAIYFPNLNGLRFIASILVVFNHVEQIKGQFSLDNFITTPFFLLSGKTGVMLFFVLSGYLITYLLLTEKKNNADISLKNFYMRRVLRIWPLYFLVLAIGAVLISISAFDITAPAYLMTQIVLFILFLPNLSLAIYGPLPYISQAWSVGVEEQFYLIWPIFIKYIKKPVKIILLTISLYLLTKLALAQAVTSFVNYSYEINIVLKFWSSLSIESLAIGALAAFVVFYSKQTILNIVYNKYIDILSYLIAIPIILLGIRIPLIHQLFCSIVFAIIIINLSTNPNSIVSLENKFFSYLGKISYGLYMYHHFVIIFTIKLLTAYGLEKNNILIYVVTFAGTIAISSVSYHLFETYFTKKKYRYTKTAQQVLVN